MPGPTCACDSMNDSDEQYPSSRVASSCLSRPPYRPVSASAKRIFLISSHLAAPSVSSVPPSEPPMKPDRSRATSPDRLFALHRASEHLQKVETRGITRASGVAEPSGNGPETRASTGNPTACKAVHIGSIPVRASKRIRDLRPDLRALRYMHSGKFGGVPLRFCRKTTRQRDDCAWTRVHHANEATAWRYVGTGSSVRKLATEGARPAVLRDAQPLLATPDLKPLPCVFHPNWTPIPSQTGHAFHVKLDSRSVATRG